MEHSHADFAGKVDRVVARGISFALGKWKQLLLTYIFTGLVGFTLLFMQTEHEASLVKRSWGGFDERPMTEKCYRQERTAMLLNLFLGSLGVDQFYAHHWVLATFKLSLFVVSLAVVCMYLFFGRSISVFFIPFRSFVLSLLSIWVLVDQILWTVGGVYGTPGCPGGSSKGWQY
ncbi:hypothetical protein N0V84_009235 [Fusarium piperis]|uniref:Uncharacterized protein n=1 Tax=Fusarium piperis TaxID=1435070 RepID=A0A9W8W6P8_9HYPO|nr:hypothetical protein N0V84_009235 [Fusarium piperis]